MKIGSSFTDIFENKCTQFYQERDAVRLLRRKQENVMTDCKRQARFPEILARTGLNLDLLTTSALTSLVNTSG